MPVPDTELPQPDEQPETDQQRKARESQARKTKREQTLLRQTRAAQLRVAGYSYEEIATALGYANAGGAWKAVEKARKDVRREAGSKLLDLEVTRLDQLQRAAMTRAIGGDPASIRVSIRVMEQRAKLLGLYELSDQTRIADARDAFAVFLGAVQAKYPDPDPMPADDDEQGAA